MFDVRLSSKYASVAGLNSCGGWDLQHDFEKKSKFLVVVFSFVVCILGLRWLAVYLGLALVFVWGCAQRGQFNFCFSRVFCWYWRGFHFGGGLGAGLSSYGV